MRAPTAARACSVVFGFSALVPAVAAAQEREGVAPVASPAIALRNPNLERTRRVVEEVIERLHTLHVDGKALSPERCRESAIANFRDHVASRSFHFLEGDARERFRRALWSFPEGNLDACIAVIDSYVGPRTAEETWTITDVLARGAIKATHDPFTQLLDRQTYDMLDLAMLGERPKGYGIKAAEKEGLLVVEHVFRGYDAAEKGLREGDVIVEVDGAPPLLLGQDEVQKRLGGEGRVRLRVFREGFSQGHDLELEARLPREPNVAWEMLPGDVGYLRVDGFLARTPEDVEIALHQLESHHARSLLLDLRDNPGGAIASCQGVAHLFLDGEKVICTTAQASGAALGLSAVPKEIKCGQGPPRTLLPMLVVVNQGTASASELLAGALQDLGRARIVGTKTHGKDVGQWSVPLASALRERFLLVTTMRYFPPKHDEKNRGIPVLPDVEVAPFQLTTAEEDEVFALRSSKAFESYLALHAAPDGETLAALAKDDGEQFDAYPGFTSWARGLGTNLTLGALRRVLHVEVRAWAARQRGLALRADLRDDLQLKRAHELAVAGELLVPPPPSTTPPKKIYY
jgi:carboxyl-terminal processing protease